MRHIIILTFFLFSIIIQAQEDTREWQQKKQKNGITIHTRLMEGSKFKEYKSTCELNATPDELLAVLLDVGNYSEWMAFVKLAEIEEIYGDSLFFVYSEVGLPWPFDNRDQVTKSIVTRDTQSGAINIEVTIIPGYLPEKKGLTRLPSGNGIWRFTPLPNDKTLAYHQFGGDPGGKIPAGIVNMFLVDGPYKTMMGLQKLLGKN